eukprot:maker-scaffold924_size80766-snap-gene-0.16 protein:Tk12431 transcript:maker-scaffold924_size80766-snap-gene-0.16-mRNA-1 annotation:"glucose dehydrogenase"
MNENVDLRRKCEVERAILKEDPHNSHSPDQTLLAISSGIYLGPLGVVGGLIGAFLIPFLKTELNQHVGLPEHEVFQKLETYYDYIVVGGGSAGCVLASRLSEYSHVSVLLLEAGGDGSLISNVPGLLGVQLGSKVDWDFKTSPDGKTCLGMKRGQCSWHLGKVIGGGSTINGMVYTRGNKADFDHWASLGNYGWSYEDVLPFFKKSEDQQNPYLAQDTRHHGVGGPMPVTDKRFRTPLAQAFLDGAKELGHKVGDVNGASQFRFTNIQANLEDGKRFSTAKAFLGSAKDRPNLTIVLKAFVTKVVIKKDRAVGVIFKKDGHYHTVKSKREIILSAGSTGSPKLLLLSGVGPSKHLIHVGIPMKKDLPVGLNMQSQVGIGEISFTVEKEVAFNVRRILYNPKVYATYLKTQTGPLTSISAVEGTGFLKSHYTNSSWPDLELFFMSLHPSIDGGMAFQNSLNLNDKQFSQFDDIRSMDGYTIIPILLHPRSRGQIRLQSRDPMAPPIIEPHYFQDPQDVKILTEGIRRAIELGGTKAFRRFGARFHDTPNPFCRHLKFMSDQYWECAMRHFTYTTYHDSGTCRMGPYDDPWSVVDAKLKVHGIHGLRVADGSIMPEVTSAHTAAACVMIGEKAAHMILHE